MGCALSPGQLHSCRSGTNGQRSYAFLGGFFGRKAWPPAVLVDELAADSHEACAIAAPSGR
jgi:hypothetical protein